MREYRSLRQTQQLLTSVRRVQEPADLGLKLRLAISREAAEARRPPYEGLRMRLENAVNAFMVPATAGLVCSGVVFCLVTVLLSVPGSGRPTHSCVWASVIHPAPIRQTLRAAT